MTDLGKTQKDYAVFLPAISSFYVKQLVKILGSDLGNARVPKGFELGNEGLDFLRDAGNYFRYPYGLYSAGHAQLDLTKTDEAEAMIQDRNRENTVILGDSGGFQVATGVIKMDWENATDPNDPARIALCEKILRWLEHTADWSMILDVPSVATIPPLNERTGLTDFQSAVDITCLNIDYFIRNRVPGATKFMNILSGNDLRSANIWYDHVTKFSDPKFIDEAYGDASRTLEGFAFAGAAKSNMYITLKLLLRLREDNLLKDKGWIHFLGTGKLNWCVYLTSIQRVLREYDSPGITLSCDAASPFISPAMGKVYGHNFFDPKKFGYFMNWAPDSQSLKGSDLPMPFNGPIMDRLVAGDLCTMEEGDLDKNGNAKGADSTSWDTQSYLYYMAHCVFNHVSAVQEANRIADIERHRADVHYSNWILDKKNKNSNEFSPFAPYSLAYFDSFVKEVLDPNCPNPHELLDKYKKFLDEISFGQLEAEQVLSSDFFDESDGNDETLEEFMDVEEILDNHED